VDRHGLKSVAGIPRNAGPTCCETVDRHRVNYAYYDHSAKTS
jgi:hypothetical protein